MRVAHVREQHAPAGAPFRLAAALADGRWLDLEHARRRLIREDPRLEHNESLCRDRITTLDAVLGQGLRLDHLRVLTEPFLEHPEWLPEAGDEADEASELAWSQDEVAFGPPLLAPLSLRDFYAFEGHVSSVWQRRGSEIPEAWYRMPIFYFSNVSEIRGPGDPVWGPRDSRELDYELEICALVDTPGRDLPADQAEDAIGGFTILNDWSARDLQRDESTVRLGPAKGKDFATTIGPWWVTPDELGDAQAGNGYDLRATAAINGRETSRGTWADIHYSFGAMLERASADALLRPGDLVASGTVGGGCLLEVREASGFGRWLEPGDTVTLSIERLGDVSTPVVERPA
jgi:fumarylacetoacetate (FAA) hydrolase